MTPERWRVVDSVVQGALALPLAERSAYLDRACGSDAALRREAESLLAATRSDEFLERSAAPPLTSLGEAEQDRASQPPPERLIAALSATYAVERELGRGGMATVYLAEDVRHRRKVAIKVLHPELSAILGPERFLKEIELTASLQHPHILPLFDSGKVDGLLYYVMPFVAGEALRARLARERQLPVSDALHIATEVASALEYAHRRGIVHRDVKPENILLADDGGALVADFGIALAASHAGGERLTQTGLSLGTPQYMAPEQVTGERSIDARADVYALGAVTYEMLAGEPPFTGSSAQAIVARVLTEAPRPLAAQRPSVAPHVAAAVHTALEKLRADRFSSARAFADALASPGDRRPEVVPTANEPVRVRLGQRATLVRWLPWTIAVLAVGIASWISGRPSATVPSEATRFTLATAGLGDLYADDGGISVALSRDGRVVAYTGRTASGRALYLRRLGELRAIHLSHTDDALPPFFSADGRWLAFGQRGRLMKLPVAGGEPTAVADVASPGSWSSRGTVVLSNEIGGLRTVSPTGVVSPLTQPETTGGAHLHRMPVVLADGETVLFADYLAAGSLNAARIGIASLSTGKFTALDLPGVSPLGVIDGMLVYVRQDRQIVAVPVDLGKGRVTGDPVPLVDQVAVGSNGLVAASLAENGTLVYVRDPQSSSIVIAGMDGHRDSIGAGQRRYATPRFSRDGRRLAVGVTEGTAQDIWVFDLASGTANRLTFEGAADKPEWTPDGQRIAYLVGRMGTRAAVWWRSADGSGEPELIASMANPIREVSFSPDGRSAILRVDTPRLQRQLWIVNLDGDRTPRPLVVAGFDALAARVSPDGHWLAYTSNESGRNEVYVRPFPGAGGRWAVSTDGGTEPVWTSDGRALLYRDGSSLLRVAVGTSPEFTVGRRDTLVRETLRENYRASYFHAMYDVSPDGRHFAFIRNGGDGAELVAVLHFDAEVRARTERSARQR
ncbi:MAG TPA: protein kinase [Gemmatimonadaceae bacterium]|nr:protein kinase [Gemmatimonadaceae bacterium]